jgi:hypothetical protein
LLKPSLTDHGVFAESAGWRTLVGSLWLAILALSVLGVRQPEAFLWLLAFQVFYKSVWLLAYVMPRLLTGRRSEIPAGITLSFVVIVLVWPWFIPWGRLFGVL